MLKKISAIICCLALWSCSVLEHQYGDSQQLYFNYETSQPVDTVDNMQSTDYSQVDLGSTTSFRVAVLLPLSGKTESMGKSLKNAAMMAVGDANNSNLVVQFYDTKSTAGGASVAVQNALSANSDLILGPLMSEEVMAIKEKTKNADVPVISFSTNPSVLESGVYTLGLLNEEQLDRIIKYAADNGRHKLALILPDNQSGINSFKYAMIAARANGVKIVKVGFYAPETMEFTSLATAMIGKERVAASQVKGKDKPQVSALDFDALLVPEFGNRLKSITSMFSYYDVSYPEVLFMGTSVWANTNLSKETELYGAVYPVMSVARLVRFSQKYNEMFGEKPNALGIFAYDAIALSSALSRKDKNAVEDEITNLDGYFGMSGAFRVFKNGKNEHALDVVKISAEGQKIAEPAPQKFYGANPGYSQGEMDLDFNNFAMPTVFGKNAQELKNILINVQ